MSVADMFGQRERDAEATEDAELMLQSHTTEFQVIRKTDENNFLQEFPEQSLEYKSTTAEGLSIM